MGGEKSSVRFSTVVILLPRIMGKFRTPENRRVRHPEWLRDG